MKSSWNSKAGSLVCLWSFEREPEYNLSWMQQTVEMQGSYLPPLTNFASHSPFSGPSWFDRYRQPR